MKISLNWLNTYLDLSGVSPDEICRAITFLGFEVEQVITTGAPKLQHVVVGEILTRGRHPNADKLSVCTVDVGAAGGVKTIVCGAPNCDAGNRVPVALPGAVLPGNFEIKLSKIRGHESQGMMCSAKELTISGDSQGLLLLDGKPAIGTPINEVLPPGDTVFDMEITPNRPDCLSHIGIARELGAWFKRELKYPEIKYTGGVSGIASIRVDVRAPEDCPLYTAVAISGVRVAPSPSWLQERLTAVGLRPINNIVDISNFVLLEYGQPTHCFDAAKIQGGTLVVRRAALGEKLVTLDGKERSLEETMLVIADAARPLVVAGVMGGEESGVSATTTDIVLEAAVFRRQAVRAASRKLGLSSDSSYRFERGIDAHSLDEAARRAIDLILELAGGRVSGPSVRVGGEAPWQREIVVTPAFINEKLGFQISAEDMRSSLEALDLVITREEPTEDRGPAWTVSIPSWRDDLDRPIDLVEEVLRVYGTEKIPATTVLAPGLVAQDDAVAVFNRTVASLLAARGFNECVNYTLRDGREIAAWAPESMVAPLALQNPFVEDQSHLRSSLVGGLLETIRFNQSRGVAVSRLFETGRVFLDRGGKLVECVSVAFALVDDPRERTWLRREAPDFYSVKRLLEIVAAPAGLDFARQPLAPFGGEGWQKDHSAMAGEIAHGWTARLGLLDVALVRKLGIEGRILAGSFAILPEKLSGGTERRRYQPVALHPAALRDVALVVDAALPSSDVQKAVAKSARAAVGNAFAVESVQVFDVYRGTGLPEGKKSLAFSLSFRAADRTLTDDEVNGAFAKLQEDLARNPALHIRK